MEAFETLYNNENNFINQVYGQCNHDNSNGGTRIKKGEKSLIVEAHTIKSRNGNDIIVAKGLFASGFVEIQLKKDGYYYIIERNNDEISYKIKQENGQEQTLAQISTTNVTLYDINIDENSITTKQGHQAFRCMAETTTDFILPEIIKTNLSKTIGDDQTHIIDVFYEMLSVVLDRKVEQISEEQRKYLSMFADAQDEINKQIEARKAAEAKSKGLREENESLTNDNSRLSGENKALQEQNKRLEREILRVRKENADLHAQIGQLYDRLKLIIGSVKRELDGFDRRILTVFRGSTISKRIRQIIEKYSIMENSEFGELPAPRNSFLYDIQSTQTKINPQGEVAITSEEIGENGGGDEHDY